MDAVSLVDNPSLLCGGVLLLGCYQQVIDGVVSSEVNLYSYFIAYLLEAFTETSSV